LFLNLQSSTTVHRATPIGPQGYAYESVVGEVIELLSFPEEFEPDDMAIEDLDLPSNAVKTEHASHCKQRP
jgi:hypothetical protein